MWQKLFDKRFAHKLVKIIQWALSRLLVTAFFMGLSGWVILGTERGRVWLMQTAINVINRSSELHIQALSLIHI